MKTNAVYLNNMTILAANISGSGTNGMRWMPTQASNPWLGCLQPNATTSLQGGAKFLKIENVRGPFKITLNYTGTGGGQTDRRPELYIDGTKVAKNFQFTDGTTNITDSYDYTGRGNVLIELGANNAIRLYRVILEVPPALTSLLLEPERTTILVDHSTTLTVIKNPLGAGDELEWIYDESYFEITDNNDGTATLTGLQVTTVPLQITIRSKDNPLIFSTEYFTVNAPTGDENFIDEINITGGDFDLTLGGEVALRTKQLVWTFEETKPGSPLYDDELTWTSDNETIATVSQTGLVTAVKAGTATIKAAANDGNGAIAEVTVTVKQLVTSLAMGNTNKFWMNVDGTLALHADTIGVLPADATNKTLTWSSSAPAIAEVDATTGMITAKAKGDANITATAADGSGINATVKVEVIDFAEEYGEADKHWKFSDAPTTGLTWDSANSRWNLGNNSISYNGLTVYGARRAGQSLSLVQTAAPDGQNHGLFTTGCINGGDATANNYVVINNLQGPFTLVVFYNGGGNSNRGRSLNIATAPAGAMATNTTTGTVQVTGATAFGTTFGLTPTFIEYEYKGIDIVDVGFRQITGAVRIHDVYLYLPSSDDIIISAEGNKTSITAGVTSGAPAETLQFTAFQNQANVTASVTWHLLDGNNRETANPINAAIATIPGGLLTAGVDFANDEDVWVFAEKDGKWSEGIKITIEKWEEPVIPKTVIYNFSVAPFTGLPTGNFAAEQNVGGLIFGSGSDRFAVTGSAAGISFTHCIRTNGGADNTRRYIVVPLTGPATITVYGASNNNTATTVNVTSTVASNVNLQTAPLNLPAWNATSSGTALGAPTYTSTTTGAHTIVLKAAASARIFMVKVDYD